MITLENPYWYKLITNLKAKREISNGVTIPYILGARKLIDNTFLIQEDSIFKLFTEIRNSSTELKVLLQNCPDVHQYVIGLREKDFCENYMKSDLSFKNENGDRVLYVTLTAIKLGNTIEEISNTLTNKYMRYMKIDEFSWDNDKQNWREFSPRERDLISTALS